MRFTARLMFWGTWRLKRCPVALLVEGSFSRATPFFFKHALSFAFLLRFSRSRLCLRASWPWKLPYLFPVDVVRKFTMPTSTPTLGANGSVSTGTSRSNARVNHQTPLRFSNVVEVLRGFPSLAWL